MHGKWRRECEMLWSHGDFIRIEATKNLDYMRVHVKVHVTLNRVLRPAVDAGQSSPKI